MSEEIKIDKGEEYTKLTMTTPLITKDEELILDNYIHDIVKNINNSYFHDKELALMQEVTRRLEQENQQLKEKYLGAVADYETTKSENQQLKESYCNRTDCSGRLHDSRKYPSVKQQLDLYKSVLDKIREYINGFDFEHLHENCEHNLVEVLEMILEILDKVKE